MFKLVKKDEKSIPRLSTGTLTLVTQVPTLDLQILILVLQIQQLILQMI